MVGTKIRIFNILKIKKHKFTGNDKYDNALQNKIIQLMLSAMFNKSRETLMIMNNTTFRAIIQSSKEYNRVTFNDKMITWLSDNTHYYTALHNHPNNSNLSIADLCQLFSKWQLSSVVICTNNCRNCAIVTKSSVIGIDKQVQIYRWLKNLIKQGYGHNSAIEVINKLENEGLIYRWYINY